MVRLIARLEIVLAIPALLLVATTVTAQGVSDFSGRWAAVPEPPAAGGGRGAPRAPSATAVASTMGSGWGTSLTIEQNPSALIVERAQFSQYDMQPAMRFSYALDGSDSRNTINMGRGPQELVSKASWQDRSLVITTRFRFSPRGGDAQTSDLTQVLSLEPSGSLVVTTTVGSAIGGPVSTTTTTYKKGS